MLTCFSLSDITRNNLSYIIKIIIYIFTVFIHETFMSFAKNFFFILGCVLQPDKYKGDSKEEFIL